ncbi:MAG: TIGR00730 family Rossman fold protein [Betaproteobacteria bacterium]|nr:TIGR00730 family Rossman fold protein [Betaproteobacteria bacterium]NBS47159.1 TIGR00730 family Rossman fold protein [Betaproteobacteria bacterium]
MESPLPPLDDRRIADAWADLQAHAASGQPLQADAYRLAFADPEFMLRRETRGIRFQLELLKPDLEQHAAGIEHTVVVFGSARFVDEPTARQRLEQARAGGDAHAIRHAERALHNASHYEQARRFGELVSRWSLAHEPAQRLYICTGGGPGIMEAANRGARDAGLASVALNIALPHEQMANPYVTPDLSFKFHYFALRKMHFMMRAKALVVFPGGFGTLDELFEVITLVQTGKAKPVPIVLFGTDYWSRLIDFEVLVEENTISPDDLALFSFTDEPEQAWARIRDFYGLSP